MPVLTAELFFFRVCRLTIHQATYPSLCAGNMHGNMWMSMNTISLKDAEKR